jgi:hypothetical protein
MSGIENQQQKRNTGGTEFNYATDKLWNYVRPMLSDLETSQRDPSKVSPGFVHDDKIGRGSYGLDERGFQTVQQFYPYFKQFNWGHVTSNPALYEHTSRAYADWMLKQLWGLTENTGLDYPQAYNELQKMWNVGAEGYKQGRRPVASRQTKADKQIKRGTK